MAWRLIDHQESYTFPIDIEDCSGEYLAIMALYNKHSPENYISLPFAKKVGFPIHKDDSSNCSYIVITWSNRKLGRYRQQTKFIIAENGKFKILFGRETDANKERSKTMNKGKGRTIISFQEGINLGLLYRVVLSDGEPSGSSLADVEARLQPEQPIPRHHLPFLREESSNPSSGNDKTQMPLMLKKYLNQDPNSPAQATPTTPQVSSPEKGSAMEKLQETLETLRTTVKTMPSATPAETAGTGASQNSGGPSTQESTSKEPKPKKKSHSRKPSQKSVSAEEDGGAERSQDSSHSPLKKSRHNKRKRRKWTAKPLT